MSKVGEKEVIELSALLRARLEECEKEDAGGVKCHDIEDRLICCSEQCREFSKKVREWGEDVFCGRVEFDDSANRRFEAELRIFLQKALLLLSEADQYHGPCDGFPTLYELQDAISEMNELLHPWVTPELAVSPSARQQFSEDPAEIEAARKSH